MEVVRVYLRIEYTIKQFIRVRKKRDETSQREKQKRVHTYEEITME